MATITEDYISFETAKLLKEKGFDIKCDKCYAYFADDDIRFLNLEYQKPAQLLSENRYPCITLQMAMKWLREVHKINIEIHYNRFGENYRYLIIYRPELLDDIRSLGDYYSYEEAAEAAIKYCLKILI